MGLPSSDAGQMEIIMRNATLDVCSRSTSSGSARSFLVQIQTCPNSLVLPNIFVSSPQRHCYYNGTLIPKRDLCCCVYCGRTMLYSIQCIMLKCTEMTISFILKLDILSCHIMTNSRAAKHIPHLPHYTVFDSVKTLSLLCASQLKSEKQK